MQAFAKPCYKTNTNLYELLLTDVSQQGSMTGCLSLAQICNLFLSDSVSYCFAVQKNDMYFKHQETRSGKTKALYEPLKLWWL